MILRGLTVSTSAFALLLVSTLAVSDEVVRRDLAGDPLPSGAVLRLGVTRLRHGSTIMAMAWSPDSKTAVTADGTLKAWDTSTGAMRWQAADGTDNAYHSLAFSPDGTLLATCGGRQSIQIWDPATGRLRYRLAEAAPNIFDNYGSLAFSPDGKSLWSLRRGGLLCRFSLDSRQGRLEFERATGCGSCLVASPAGNTVACWQEKTLRVVDGRSGEDIFTKTGADNFWSLDFSPDGKLLAAGLEDGSIEAWEVPSGERVFQRQEVHGHWRPWVNFVPQLPALLVSSGNDGIIRFWDVEQNRETKTIVAKLGEAVPSHDGKRICLCRAGAISFWDTSTGQENPRLVGHTGAVTSLAFSPDGAVLATTSGYDPTLRLWGLSTAEQLAEFPGFFNSPRLTPDSRSLVADQTRSVVNDQNYQLWVFGIDGRSDPLGEQPPRQSQAILSPDGKLLVVSCSWLKVRVDPSQPFEQQFALQGWDLPERRLRWELKDVIARVVGFLPQGNHFVGVKAVPVAGSRPRFFATLWDGNDGAELLAIPGHEPLPPDTKLPKGATDHDRFPPTPGLCLSNDGTRLAMVEGKFPMRIFELPSGKALQTLSRERPPAPNATQGQFSPDKRWLIFGAHRTEFWDLNLGCAVETFGSPLSSALSTDGRLLATATQEGALCLWDFANQRLLASISTGSKSHPSIAFAPDGKTLAVATGEGAVLIYSTDPQTWPTTDEKRPSTITPDDLWIALEGNASAAWQAIEQLVAQPDAATAMLRKRLQPEMADAGPIQRWIVDLAAADEATRSAAGKELAQRGSAIARALREALSASPTPQAKQIMTTLLAALDRPVIESEYDLRRHRAIQVLERISSAESIRLLQQLADQSDSPREKREAAAALRRHQPVKEASQ